MAKTKRENVEDMLVAAFLMCPNVAEVSRKTDISRAVIYRIVESESFQKKLADAKKEALQGTVNFMQGGLSECAATLMKIIKDGNTSSQIKINAIQAFMSQCKSLTDTVDILNRISKLEEEMEKERGNHGGNSTKAFKP